MPRRLPRILLVLALSTVPAYAQTTTTTNPNSGCRAELGSRVLCGMGSRLETFREAFSETYNDDPDDLGRLYFAVAYRLQWSSFCLQNAYIKCIGKEPTPPGRAPRIIPNVDRARAKLQSCIRPLYGALAKLRSRSARRRLPPEVAGALASEVAGIAGDLEAVRKSLTTCP